MSEPGNGTPDEEQAEQPKSDPNHEKELVERLICLYVMSCFLNSSTSLSALSTSDHRGVIFPTHSPTAHKVCGLRRTTSLQGDSVCRGGPMCGPPL